jgi:hypothetical protein
MSYLIKDVRGSTAQELKPLTVTVATAKRISGLGNTTIWSLIKAGKLQTIHVGRRTLVAFCSLEALLAPRAEKSNIKRQNQKPAPNSQFDHKQRVPRAALERTPGKL